MNDKIQAKKDEYEKKVADEKAAFDAINEAHEAEIARQMEEMNQQNQSEEEMLRRIQTQKDDFEDQQREREEEMEADRKKHQEELDEQLREQMQEQERVQNVKEIESRLQQIVPMITEINLICSEIGRENVRYEPDIINEIRPDGTKVAKVVVRVYPDAEDEDAESAVIPCDIFMDNIYFDVKDLYEAAEEKGFDDVFHDKEDDAEIFGWNLVDCWQNIGTGFVFLITMFNLCENINEETIIIDPKGEKAGDLDYCLSLELIDEDKTTPLKMQLYESVDQIIGKYLKFTVKIKKAMKIPEKFQFKSKCSYEWIEYPNDTFETTIIYDSCDPQFNFEEEHLVEVTEELSQYMRFNTLQLDVWGMIEGMTKKLSDKRKIAGTTWAELRDAAMKPDFKKGAIYVSISFQCRFRN